MALAKISYIEKLTKTLNCIKDWDSIKNKEKEYLKKRLDYDPYKKETWLLEELHYKQTEKSIEEQGEEHQKTLSDWLEYSKIEKDVESVLNELTTIGNLKKNTSKVKEKLGLEKKQGIPGNILESMQWLLNNKK